MQRRTANHVVPSADKYTLEGMRNVAHTLRKALLDDGWTEPRSGERVALAVVPDVNSGSRGIIRQILGAALHRDSKRGGAQHSLSINWYEWESLEPGGRSYVPDAGAATLVFGDRPYSPVRIWGGSRSLTLARTKQTLYRASVDLSAQYDESKYNFHLRFDLAGLASHPTSTGITDAAYDGREVLGEGLSNGCRLPTRSIAAASALVMKMVVEPPSEYSDIGPF